MDVIETHSGEMRAKRVTDGDIWLGSVGWGLSLTPAEFRALLDAMNQLKERIETRCVDHASIGTEPDRCFCVRTDTHTQHECEHGYKWPHP